MARTITVIGSINVDHILQIEHNPEPGETIKANQISLAAGGKGANQAVASVRMGCNTNFIGAVGTDAESKFMLQELRRNGINTAGITKMDYETTGQAFVLVQEAGENSIIVNSGANAQLSPKMITANEHFITNADFVLAQLETPEKTTIKAFELAKEHGASTLLNPSPASPLSAALLKLTDLVIMNEPEVKRITGIKETDPASLTEMARFFHNQGVKVVIITLGERGSFSSNDGQEIAVPPVKAHEIDPTGAGDAYIGALVTHVKRDYSNLAEALLYASHASALAVQQLSAFPAMPTKEEVEASIARQQ
ncbi:Sugar kinase, ribokinase family protein [Amylolactobacillus amylotrophicus DSM 20534]|uniref:Ribokinase n=3 Tax=Amylolactobacillus TaxID=2767876 RepID=A0A0R1YM48_9LACO|nr:MULTISPECIES: ribokinase [Amylolactobacillus]APT18599.1 ribokinase [Amylolactobacillus amylophilus DSM 20533 = JCM 1125]KRK36817.1 Sugar kinase, ribokinase family protein [Amylolactobacillus amylotrophicus DSM 20534]KRM43297.1 Sugar kinase, ribokinase family protein [Amylolactobacillus amylophilus DSM 20533 = JCM 1125]GED80977.1 ribokinase [Amylolactobacillus amylophilus]